jgi:asparagine synthase (glutamine-hydrolysing)
VYPATCWQGVQNLPPGHWLTIDARGVRTQPWAATALPTDSLENLLQRSVTRHLRADVPVGLWLSGGVDSTLLLALAREQGHSVPCFSIGLNPSEGSFGTDDYQFARRAAHQYGADFTEFTADDSLLNHTDEALAALGQPIADSSVLLTWWLAQQTRAAGFKAVLSGAGADELFAGYNRHRAFAWYLRRRRLLVALAPGLRAGATLLPSGADGPWRKRLRLIRHLAMRLRDTPMATFQQFAALDPALTDLLAHPRPHTAAEALYDVAAGDALRAALDYDRRHYLVNDILALTDQTAMRHGLEVRTPYLDQDVQALAVAWPAAELLRHGPKWHLRALLAARGGHVFTQRSKEGFGLPLTRWLRLPKYAWLFAPLHRADHPLFAHLDFAKTQAFLRQFQQGRHDFGAEAWALLTLFRWWDVRGRGGRLEVRG